jgi:hypothetical protein
MVVDSFIELFDEEGVVFTITFDRILVNALVFTGKKTIPVKMKTTIANFGRNRCMREDHKIIV